MTIEVRHKFVSPKADAPDTSIVRPTNWNDTHAMTAAGGTVLGRSDIGDGDVEELPIAVKMSAEQTTRFQMAGAIGLPHGDTVDRPATPEAGMVRWNAELAQFEGYNGTAWIKFKLASDSDTPAGAVIFTFSPQEPSGWVIATGTIGDASSAATRRANADCHALFLELYNWPDAIAPVSGGRGANAEADWTAHKRIQIPDFREYVLSPNGNLGGSTPPNRIGLGSTGGFAGTATNFASGGEKAHIQTVAEMPVHRHNIVAVNTFSGPASGSQTGNTGTLFSTTETADAGGGAGHNNVQPTFMMFCLVKL